MDVYGFLLAGFLLTMGTLGDRIGRRRLLLIGAAASVWPRCSPLSRPAPRCSSQPEPSSVSQGPACALHPLLIRNMFVNTEQRAFAIGV